MPITEGHYNVVLKGKYNGSQDIVNSFYFEVLFNGGTLAGDDAELFSIGKRMWDNIKATLRPLTSSLVSYNMIDVFKADGDDVGASGFYTIPDAERLGDQVGDALPPFVAWTFQYTRPNASYRHGYKRFAGVVEAAQVAGIPASNTIAPLNSLASALGSSVPLNAAVTLTPRAYPALVQRQFNNLPVDPDRWYRPSAVVFKKIGSQNTRKFGFGS